MIKISHRINNIKSLSITPVNFGVELDLRDNGKEIIISHDPFQDGEKFEDYLKNYHHKFLIANIKTAGIADVVLSLLKKNSIEDFFLLDLSFPEIIKLAKLGEKRIAYRYSEYEAIDTILNLKGMIDWIWVDCFNNFPMDQLSHKLLTKYFKLCLVSPELQGHSDEQLKNYKEKIKEMPFDAVCTKRLNFWN